LGERETGGRKIRKGQGNSREAFPQKRDGDRWPEEQIGCTYPYLMTAGPTTDKRAKPP